MLLHVIATPLHVNGAPNPGALLEIRPSVDVVQNPSVFPVDNFAYPKFLTARAHPPGIENLAAAGWVESSLIQQDSRTLRRIIGRNNVDDIGVEFIQKRVAIIESMSHGITAAARKDNSLVRSDDSANMPGGILPSSLWRMCVDNIEIL